MRTFSCFINDDRYSVPTLVFLTAIDEPSAQEMALARLMESPHHRGVELRDGARRIYARERMPKGGGEQPHRPAA